MSKYHQIAKQIKAFEPFDGKQVSAKLNGDIYTVYSYKTAMLTINIKTGKPVKFETRHWGSTTARLQNLLAKTFGYELPPLEQREQANIPKATKGKDGKAVRLN